MAYLLEPVSSSDDDEVENGVNNIQSLEDLQSDDSCAEEIRSSSSSDVSLSSVDIDDEKSEGGNANDFGLTLEEEMIRRRHQGRQVDKKRLVESKKKALEVACSLVKNLQNKKKGGNTEKNNNASDYVSSLPPDKSNTRSSNLRNVKQGSKKKRSKHAPTEASSKRYDYFKRGAPSLQNSGVAPIAANSYKPRDPRMQSLSGHLDENVFDHRYSFLDEIQEKEISETKARIVAYKKTGKRGSRARKKLGIVGGDEFFVKVRYNIT